MITTNTFRRHRLLGSIDQDGSRPSPIGEAVAAAWESIPMHRPWITLGESVVMPDHFHGILHCSRVPPGRVGSLIHVVGGFKAGAVRFARELGELGAAERLWHGGFDVRFLNTERSIARCEAYIRNNPRVWFRGQFRS